MQSLCEWLVDMDVIPGIDHQLTGCDKAREVETYLRKGEYDRLKILTGMYEFIKTKKITHYVAKSISEQLLILLASQRTSVMKQRLHSKPALIILLVLKPVDVIRRKKETSNESSSPSGILKRWILTRGSVLLDTRFSQLPN